MHVLIPLLLMLSLFQPAEKRSVDSAYRVDAIETGNLGSEAIRIGDLDGDSAPDLLFVQSEYGSRVIRCLTAMTLQGKQLWQHGTPSSDYGRIFSDLPVQIYDWDNDGINEVLFVRQADYVEPVEYGVDKIRERAVTYSGHATMVILNGRSGMEKATVPLPAPADDSFAFADLSGRGWRQDFVVKDRYWNIWGVSSAGKVLWSWQGSTGHYPAVADIDDDGRDEVFIGYALIDHDGRVLFQKDSGDAHQDASCMVRLADGSWRLLFGNHGVHCLAKDGKELWQHPLREAQHVVVGRFRRDSALQVAVIDRGYPRTADGNPAHLILYDLETGREIWRRAQPPGGWAAACQNIHWSGREDMNEILVYHRGPGQNVAVYDGEGDIVAEIDIPLSICSSYRDPVLMKENPGIHYAYRADLWGDRREEIIVTGWKGVRIYANARSFLLPTQYNATLYHGM